MNLKTEVTTEKSKMEDIFPTHSVFVHGSTFHRGDVSSSLDHILVQKKYGRIFKCFNYKNIYSDHSGITIRYYIFVIQSLTEFEMITPRKKSL